VPAGDKQTASDDDVTAAAVTDWEAN